MDTPAPPRTPGATASAPDEGVSDGRRLRSSRSREQIIRAMLALIRAGDMSPSAARVAEAAGISLRTVFRHFEEMDTLYREMTTVIEAEVRPLLERPLEGRTWRVRLDELVARRLDIYERILPLKVAGSVRRFQSDYLMEDYNRFLRLEHEGLLEVLPQKIIADRVLFASIEMVTAFQAWRRIRQDQGLPVKEAATVVRFTLDQLLAGR